MAPYRQRLSLLATGYKGKALRFYGNASPLHMLIYVPAGTDRITIVTANVMNMGEWQFSAF